MTDLHRKLLSCRALSALLAAALFQQIIPLYAKDFRPEKIPYAKQRLFACPPKITGFKGSRAVCEIYTLRKCPPVSIDYGVDSRSVGGLLGPVFRKTAHQWTGSMDGRYVPLTRHHQVLINVAKLEHFWYGQNLIDQGGGSVVFQVQGYDPASHSAVLRQGRFSYRRRGPVKDGKYRLVTSIVTGPFIDNVTPGAAVVSWSTDRASEGSVSFWKAGGKKRVVLSTTGKGKHQQVTLGELRPGSRYFYEVDPGNEGFRAGPFSFRTAPEAGSDKPFKFVFMSDGRNGAGPGRVNLTGCNASMVSRLMSLAYRSDANFVIFGGDLVNGYTSSREHFKAQLMAFKQAIQRVAAHIPVYEAVGNHETLATYYRIPDFEEKGKSFFAYQATPDPFSVCSIFSRMFVNPSGSCYDNSSPLPEHLSTPATGSAFYRADGPMYAETVYSFRHGNCLFIVLNSNYWTTAVKGMPGGCRKFADRDGNDYVLKMLGGNREGYLLPNQLKWLKNELARGQADPAVRHIFVSLHEPPFPCGGHLSDAMFWGRTGKGEEGGYDNPAVPMGDVLSMRDRFIRSMLDNNKVVAVMTGDEHNYSRTLIDRRVHPSYRGRLWQIISGGAGAPYYRTDPSVPWKSSIRAFSPSTHLCLFEIDGGRVGLKVLSEDGVVLDEVDDLLNAK